MGTLTIPPLAVGTAPSRSSGVAPLTVWFDATSVTSTTTTKPFHHIEYRWDFGDGGTNWGTTGLSTNAATGAMAAHVYRNASATPFTATLTAFDGINTASCTMTVTVTSADTQFSGTNTVCVANATPTAGAGDCPAGAAVLAGTSNFATAMAQATSGKRVLLKRGDTFTLSGGGGGTNLTAAGPGIIGAYGTGALPLVNMTGNFGTNAAINISGGANDWRIMDLEFNGSGSSNAAGISFVGNANRITMSGLNIHNTREGLVLSEFIANFVSLTIWSQIALVDSAFSTINTYLVYGAAERFAILGNTLLTSTGSHVFRTQYFTRGVFSNNILRNPGSAGTNVVKFGAPCFASGPSCIDPNGDDAFVKPPFAGQYTENSVISDNVFSSTLSDWTMSMGPENHVLDERVRNILVERNLFQVGSGATAVSSALVNFGADVTIRNNLFDMTNGHTDSVPIIVRQRGGGQLIPTGNEIYNNSFYKPSSGEMFAILVQSPAAATVQNNLVHAPLSNPLQVVGGNGTITTTPGSNSSNAQALTLPNWVATPPCPASPPTLCNPLNWRIQTGSYAIGTGVAVPVWSDGLGTPHTATRHKGAINP